VNQVTGLNRVVGTPRAFLHICPPDLVPDGIERDVQQVSSAAGYPDKVRDCIGGSDQILLSMRRDELIEFLVEKCNPMKEYVFSRPIGRLVRIVCLQTHLMMEGTYVIEYIH
jgi:hypothetical protein